MGVLVGLAVGYLIGAKTGSRDLDQLTQALKNLTQSEEFSEVVAALRGHAEHTLRNLADLVSTDSTGASGLPIEASDLVDRVRLLFERDQARQ
jgi:hypothetical protein